MGGPIFTMNKNNDIAEAIAVKGETILAVGKKAEVMAAAGSGASVMRPVPVSTAKPKTRKSAIG